MKKKPLPLTVKIVIKIVAIFITGWLLTMVGIFTIENIAESTEDDNNMARMVNQCDSYYYEKDYGELRDILTLYDLYDDEFQVYWDAVDAYEAKLEAADTIRMNAREEANE